MLAHAVPSSTPIYFCVQSKAQNLPLHARAGARGCYTRSISEKIPYPNMRGRLLVAPKRLWQSRQRTRRLPALLSPPSDFGRMWSTVRRAWLVPHISHHGRAARILLLNRCQAASYPRACLLGRLGFSVLGRVCASQRVAFVGTPQVRQGLSTGSTSVKVISRCRAAD